MVGRRPWTALLAVVCLRAMGLAFTDTFVIDALWIGNSFTAKYVLPNSLRTMFRGAPDETYISLRNTERIEWGQDLKYHYENTDAYQTLTSGSFDYVVLQDFPYTGSATERQDLDHYGSLFVDAAHASGAVPIIFYTWPPEANKAHLQDIIDMYEAFCAQREVMVAPASVAWRHIFGQAPSYPIYNDDALHQSPYGHYLNLSVFYSIFKEFSAEGNAYRVWGEYPSAPLTQISADTAAYLQAQAWAVVDSMLGPFATAAVPRPLRGIVAEACHEYGCLTTLGGSKVGVVSPAPATLFLLNGMVTTARRRARPASARYIFPTR